MKHSHRRRFQSRKTHQKIFQRRRQFLAFELLFPAKPN
jgi:hypothetical protein